MVAGNGALCIQPSRILDHRDARNTARRSRNPRSAAVPTAAATSEPGRWKFVAPLRVRSCCGGTPRSGIPRGPRGFLPERGCVRGAPTAAGWPHGKRLISTGAYGVSGPLRLVLGGHSRAPLAAAPPLGPATLQNPRTTRGCYHRTNGQPGPQPTRQFPFLCPKFPCPTRPCSRAAPSTAATQITQLPPRRQRVRPAQVVANSPCAIPSSRAPHGLRLCRRVFIVSLWFSPRFPLYRYR